jgi:hypothetical protein
MPEPLRLAVAVVVAKVLVLLRAIVPRQLEQALAVGGALVLAGNSLLAGVAQKVKVEAGRLGLVLPEQRHAQHLLVELERLLGVLDT